MLHMMTSETVPTRTLALELPETEWKALRAIEPDTVGWLRALIHTRVGASVAPPLREPKTTTSDGAQGARA
jgi:hypothetical protein